MNNSHLLTVVYQKISEFGDREDLFNAFIESLHKREINFKQTIEKITFNLDNPFIGLNGKFSLIRDSDCKYEYGNYTIAVKYISENTHEDIIDEFKNTFEKIVYSQNAYYEEYEQEYSAKREYYIKEIKITKNEDFC